MAARDIRPEVSGVPKRLGRYEVLLEIASGGMASVFLGRSTAMAGFERIVAIKCCHPHLLRTDEEFCADPGPVCAVCALP